MLAVSPAAALAQTGRVEGIVSDSRTKRPLDDVVLALVPRGGTDPIARDTTGNDGRYAFTTAPDDYTISVEHDDFETRTLKVTVQADSVAVAHVALFRPDRLFSSLHFEPHEPNYFLAGTDGATDEPGYQNQIKFRIAVRYALLGFDRFAGQTGVYAAYTQDSFWNLWNESAPFYDNNYAPEVLGYLDARDWTSKDITRYVPSVRPYFRHQSNGRDGVDSRSWNRLGVGFEWGGGSSPLQHLSLDFWGVVSDAPENRDIRQTNGSGEVRVDLAPFIRSGWTLDRFGLSVRSRILGTQVFENVEVNGYLRFPGNPGWFELPPSLMVQAFCGRGEVLLDHRADRCSLRAGIAVMN